MTGRTELVLPDLISICPFPWSPSPHHARGLYESMQWADSYSTLADRKRSLAIIEDVSILASYAYSYAEYEEFRTSVDLLVVLFILDEISDSQNEDGVRKTEEIVRRALTGQKCNGSPLSRFVNSFMHRIAKAAPLCQKRFIQHSIEYFSAVVDEADFRSKVVFYDIEEFFIRRRNNGGAKPCFDLIEYILGFEIPDCVVQDENFVTCLECANDLICIANDLYSYAVEHENHLDGNNAIEILMRTKGLNVQGAANWIENKFKELLRTYLKAKDRMSSFGADVDTMVDKYLRGAEQWVGGNLAWSFDCQRYFGERHKEIKETLKVNIESSVG